MTDQFLTGALVGTLLIGAFWILSAQTYKKLLKDKAECAHPTAEKLGNAFYYIVPEVDYVRMKLAEFKLGELDAHKDDTYEELGLRLAETSLALRQLQQLCAQGLLDQPSNAALATLVQEALKQAESLLKQTSSDALQPV